MQGAAAKPAKPRSPALLAPLRPYPPRSRGASWVRGPRTPRPPPAMLPGLGSPRTCTHLCHEVISCLPAPDLREAPPRPVTQMLDTQWPSLRTGWLMSRAESCVSGTSPSAPPAGAARREVLSPLGLWAHGVVADCRPPYSPTLRPLLRCRHHLSHCQLGMRRSGY